MKRFLLVLVILVAVFLMFTDTAEAFRYRVYYGYPGYYSAYYAPYPYVGYCPTYYRPACCPTCYPAYYPAAYPTYYAPTYRVAYPACGCW